MNEKEDTELDALRVEIRKNIQRAGFSPEQTNDIIEGINLLEEASQRLGVLSKKEVTELSDIVVPLMSMFALNLDYNDPEYVKNYELIRMLAGVTMRAAYQLGGRDMLQREDDKDLPNGPNEKI